MRTIFLFYFGFCFCMAHYGQAQESPNDTAIDYQSARPEQTFQVFQFPRDQMPRMDGQTDDWEMVPASYTYGTDQLKDTEDGMGANIDPEDLDVKVTVGWVKGMNRLYILYEAYDDYWDFGRFNPNGYLNDIFEIVVDGNFSGGPLITNPLIEGAGQWGNSPAHIANHMQFSGVHAQNYHIYTPPVNNAWVLVWGTQPWIGDFPQANYAYNYDFQPGESGKLILECWITPYDHAPYEGPEKAIPSKLEENKIIGLSWSILDFDGGKREGHINLAHNTKMVNNADFLCQFKLMPLEEMFKPDLKAAWDYEIINPEERLVAFKDKSIGEINEWHWDFGDGNTSNKKNPVHRYDQPGIYYVVTLEVKGPDGSSKRTRYWEIKLK